MAEWTTARVERLTELWAGGLSASQIAAEMGGMTRHSVLGKAHRLGLSGRAEPDNSHCRSRFPRKDDYTRNSAGKRASRIAAKRAARLRSIEMETGPDEPESHRISLIELTDHTCKWPSGDGAAITFCGLRTTDESPYCPYHDARAYQPL